MELFIVAIMGLLIGSFLNVCIFRIPKGESVVYTRSHCLNCLKTLSASDLIPVVSYVLNRGKCKYCGIKISPQYILVELLNMVIYIILYINFSLTTQFLVFAPVCSILLVIFFIDLKTLTIPNSLVIILFLISFIYNIYENNILNALIGFLFGFIFFLVIALVSHGGMGGGDIKLAGALGLLLGFNLTVVMVFLSFVLGGIISLILLASKVKTKKDPIAFGPFIVISTYITLLFGESIIYFYSTHLWF